MGFGGFIASPVLLNVLTRYGSFGWDRMILSLMAIWYSDGKALPLFKVILI
jgi:hypothetical protein